MNLTKPKRRVLLSAIVGGLLLYFVVPFPILSENSRANVREASLHWLLKRTDMKKVCYVGWTSETNWASEDPPPELLKHFAELGVQVQPQSAIKTNNVGVIDNFGRPAESISVGKCKRWSLGLVYCTGSCYEGSEGVVGYTIYVLRIPFAWIPLGGVVRYVS